MAPHREKEIAHDAMETLGNVFLLSDMHSGKQSGQRDVCGHVEGWQVGTHVQFAGVSTHGTRLQRLDCSCLL